MDPSQRISVNQKSRLDHRHTHSHSLYNKDGENEGDPNHPEYEIYLMDNNYDARLHQQSMEMVHSVLNTGDDTKNETEVLNKLSRRYPGSVAFDTARYRNSKTKDISLSERLLEHELEQRLKWKEELIQDRRSSLLPSDESRDGMQRPTMISTYQTMSASNLPINTKGYSTWNGDDGDVPESILYRKIREDTIDSQCAIPRVKLPASDANIQEQEIKLAKEPRNTREFTSRLFTQFYKDQISAAKLQKYKILHRWSRYAGNVMQFERTDPILRSRLSRIDELHEACRVRHSELSNGIIDEGNENPLHVKDFEMFIRHTVHQLTTKRHIDHFTGKMKWLSYTERFNLFRKAFEADKSGKQETTLPRFAVHASEIHAQFEEIKSCFDLGRALGSDHEFGQEFLYRVSKNFNVVFMAQAKVLRFLPYPFSRGISDLSHALQRHQEEQDTLNVVENDVAEQKIPPTNNNGVKDRKKKLADQFHRKKTVHLKSLPFEPMEHFTEVTVPVEQKKQAAVLRETTTIDTALRNEAAFLGTYDVAYASKRLKSQVETHFQRAHLRKIVSSEDDDKPFLPASEDGKSTMNQLQAIYMLRYNKIREFKKKILDILNYFRSLQRRFTLDKYGYNVTNPDAERNSPIYDDAEERFSHFIKRVFTDIGDLEPVVSEALMSSAAASNDVSKSNVGASANETASTHSKFNWKHAFVDNRDDTYYLINNRDLAVKDSNGIQIMYTEAIQDLDDLEQELLAIGSTFIDKNLDKLSTSSSSLTRHWHEGSRTRMTEETNSRENEIEVDRFLVLEDLYESEAWFQDTKRKVIDCYMEAYEHSCDPETQKELAMIILNLMMMRPILDLKNNEYFTENYASEIMTLELKYSLLRDIISHQIGMERDYSRRVHQPSKQEGDGSMLGHPHKLIEESSLRTALFPGSTRVGFLDMYSSLSNIAGVYHVLENAVLGIKQSFEIKNPSVATALKRTILQQALVEWKLLTEEDKIQKSVQLKMTGDRRALEKRILMEDADELLHIALSVAKQGPDTSREEYLGKEEESSQSNNPTGSKREDSDVDMMENFDQDLTPTDALSNMLEMLLLWKSLVDQMYESDVLYNIHLRQAAVVVSGNNNLENGNDSAKPNPSQMEEYLPLKDPIAFTHDDSAKRANIVGGDLGEVLAFKSHMLGNLAISEFSSDFVNFNFESKEDLRRIVRGTELKELRQSFQYQVTQRILVQNCVRINQVLLDNLLLNNRGRKSVRDVFNLTSIPLDEFNPYFRDSLFRTTSLDQHRLEHLFLNPNSFKDESRKQALESYTRISDHIMKNREKSVVNRRLKDLKIGLANEYCLSMIVSITSLAVKYQIMTTSRRIRSVANDMIPNEARNGLVPDTGLIIGDEHDEMQTTAQFVDDVQTGNARSTASSSTEMSTSKYNTSRNGTCAMARDGLVVNPLYVPHFLQVLSLEFNGSDSKGNFARSRFKGSQLFHLQLEILQANYMILLFLRSTLQMSTTSSIIAANPLHSLKEIPQHFRKIGSEIAHLTSTEDPFTVRDYLIKKADILFMKTTITLSKLNDLLRSNLDFAGSKCVEDAFLKLMVNGGCSLKCEYEIPVERSDARITENERSHGTVSSLVMLLRDNPDLIERFDKDSFLHRPTYLQPFCSFSQNYFWPLMSALFISRDKKIGSYHKLLDNQLVVSESLNFPFEHILSAFLVELNEPQRNFYQGIDMHIDEQLDDVLMEAKKYSSMQSNASSLIQFETMKTLLAQSMLKRHFMQSLARNFPEDIVNDVKRMEEVFNNVITRKARLQYDKDIIEHNQRVADENLKDDDSKTKTDDGYEAEDLDAYVTGDTRTKSHKELLQRELLVLRQEYNKLLTLDMIRSSSNEIRNIQREFRAAGLVPQTTGSHHQSLQRQNSRFPYSEDDSDDRSHFASDGKLEIFHEFLQSLVKRGAKSKTKSGIPAITIHEQDLKNALDIVGTHLKKWKQDRLEDVGKSANIIVDHHKQVIFNLEQKVKFLESMREMDKKSFSRRVSNETADKSYDLVFQVDTLTRENNKLLKRLLMIKEEAKNEMRTEYEGTVTELARELLNTQNKFNDYKRSFHQGLDKEFSQVKEETIVKLATSKDGPITLQSQVLQVVMDDNEINKLRRINENQEAGAQKLGVFHRLRQLSIREKYEKRVRSAEEGKELATVKFFGDKQQLEVRQNLLRQSLIKSQSALSNAEKEIEEIRNELKMEIKNKERLRIWKNKHAELFNQLQKQIEQYERWNKYDVDKLVLELEKKRVQVKQLEQIEDRMNKKVEHLERQSQKQMEEMKRRLQRETILKMKAIQRMESLSPVLSTGQTTLGESSHSNGRIEPLGTSAMWQKKYYDAVAELNFALRDVESMKDVLLQRGIEPADVLGRLESSFSMRQSASTLGRRTGMLDQTTLSDAHSTVSGTSSSAVRIMPSYSRKSNRSVSQASIRSPSSISGSRMKSTM